VAAGHRADQQAAGDERAMDQVQGEGKLVDRIERSDSDANIIFALPEIVSVLFGEQASGPPCKKLPRVDDIDRPGKFAQALRPGWGRASDQQRLASTSADCPDAVEAIVECAVEQEHFRTGPRGAVAAESAQFSVEQVAGHAGACAVASAARQEGMARWLEPLRILGNSILNFALPPRCAGCAEVIEEVGAFCPDCWGQMEWLGKSGCLTCGMPLSATEAESCARCLADPPGLDRMRAAVAYDDLSRSLVLRLKYGRKVALARTMARYMVSLGEPERGEALVIPVPLHRRRLWSRGFNQSGLVALHLAKSWGYPFEAGMLRRTKPTRPLKGMSHSQRRKAVAGAFAVAEPDRVKGRDIILIDDVLTSGSTAEACARALRKAGAARVELICWARVVRPAHLMR